VATAAEGATTTAGSLSPSFFLLRMSFLTTIVPQAGAQLFEHNRQIDASFKEFKKNR
jgi:hypothetical protein